METTSSPIYTVPKFSQILRNCGIPVRCGQIGRMFDCCGSGILNEILNLKYKLLFNHSNDYDDIETMIDHEVLNTIGYIDRRS